jgi:ribosomal protein L29
MTRKKMTPAEIAEKAQEIKEEVYNISLPLTTAAQLAMFKQVKRIVNDLCVLIRENANNTPR